MEIQARGIFVAPLSAVQGINKEQTPSHIISLLAPEGVRAPVFPGHARHLALYFNDITEPCEDMIPPGPEHAQELVEFLNGWYGEAPLLIHCWAGISRSTAAAYIALCLFNPAVSEETLAQLLRRQAPEATPNGLLVALGDKLLEREGRMSRAIEAIGRGRETFEGTPFILPHPARTLPDGGAAVMR